MDYKKQIAEASKDNAFKIGAYRELRRLPMYLHEGEEVVKIVVGSPHKVNRMGQPSHKSEKSRGLVVATTERILFLRDGWVFRSSQDYPYETISSVEFNTGVFFGSLSLYGKGDETKYSGVGRVSGAEFVKTVRQLISQHKNGGIKTNTETLKTVTEPDELTQRLSVLEAAYRFGQVSEEDYHAQRAKLLA